MWFLALRILVCQSSVVGAAQTIAGLLEEPNIVGYDHEPLEGADVAAGFLGYPILSMEPVHVVVRALVQENVSVESRGELHAVEQRCSSASPPKSCRWLEEHWQVALQFP